MNKLKTNEEIIKEILTAEEQAELKAEIEKEVKRGGARIGAGRKKKNPDNVLQFQVRVTQKEKDFLAYAREHQLNYDDLMQG